MELSTGGNMEKSHEVFSPAVLRRKRTKRLRAEAESAAASSSSAAEPCSSATGREEEATARCLIFLAQGWDSSPPPDSSEWKSFVAAAASGGGRRFPGGECAYDCKTCGKSFPSFQALGGHRTSHTKNKDAAPPPGEAKRVPAKEEDVGQVCNSPKPLRVHECVICRMAFSSGQALGGHMRKHRPITAAADEAALPGVKNEVIKNAFVLDLNLPAPPEDEGASEDHHMVSPPPSTVAFPFENQQPLVFPAPPALVDCHY
ncbi:zinc finger protein ZAT5-like [Curcuma longa]|uniref:zinc finger protein ZAT5-like n=1 Tax=Curcuma longa TaxID=136217 RepID=UPI003D9F829A